MRIAIALLAAFVLLVSAAGSTGSVVGTITAVEKTVFKRAEPVGTPAADLEVSRTKLRTLRGKLIGFGTLVCTSIDKTLKECSGTYSLPGGRIIVHGLVIEPARYTLAVTGGTGLYNGATGEAHISAGFRVGERDVTIKVR